jgi:galactose-1-phosphate uridylyltransferase
MSADIHHVTLHTHLELGVLEFHVSMQYTTLWEGDFLASKQASCIRWKLDVYKDAVLGVNIAEIQVVHSRSKPSARKREQHFALRNVKSVEDMTSENHSNGLYHQFLSQFILD